MIQVIKNFFLAFMEEALLNAVRGPLIVVVLTPVIASSGAWQFLSNSWAASDFRAAGSMSAANTRVPSMAVVAIDDTGYQSFFDAKSPLDRDRLESLLRVIDQHSKSAKRIALDIDTSPVPGQAQGQAKLDELFLQNPGRWVLAAVNSGSPADIEEQGRWRAELCRRGLSFGLPYMPNEFGYPKLTHQYRNSLSDTALQPAGHCADPADPFVQKTMVMSPLVLNAALVIPFSGDLEALGQVLDYVDAEWIFVGGAWGMTDILGTPFGDRYGVQVHLAALAGALSDEREASFLVSMTTTFFFISFCTVMLKYMNLLFDGWFRPQSPLMVGHVFYLERLQALQFVFLVFLMLWLFSYGLAILRASTGYWIPMSFIGSSTLASLLLSWNWGQNKAPDHKGFSHMWKHNVVIPIRRDLGSIAWAFAVIKNGPSQVAWNVDSAQPPIGRGRAATEGFFAVLSIVMQTVLPIMLIVYTIYQGLVAS